MTRRVERMWERDGAGAAVLTPLAWLYAAVTAARNAAYDRGWLPTHALAAPAVSIGNLSVGGTGKTPVSAWVAGELLRRGERPGILLRGYGSDEPLVHERLTPGAVVIANPDRVRASHAARAAGASVLVLDDAFQHRRARRDADIVLVAAEQGLATRRLPAGPLREGARALRRADLLIVTRKTAAAADAVATGERWRAAAGVDAPDALPLACVHLAADGLRTASGERLALHALRDRRVLAISAVGAPTAFEAQLAAAGAVVEPAAFPDHHAFSDAEVMALAARAQGADMAVCTLKDAVKLWHRWPRQAPALWYLSQSVVLERGEREFARLLDRLLTRSTHPTDPVPPA